MSSVDCSPSVSEIANYNDDVLGKEENGGGVVLIDYNRHFFNNKLFRTIHVCLYELCIIALWPYREPKNKFNKTHRGGI